MMTLEEYFESRRKQFNKVLIKATIPGVSSGIGKYSREGMERADKGGTHQMGAGVYVDNPYNRWLGRVGQPYASEQQIQHGHAVRESIKPGAVMKFNDGSVGTFHSHDVKTNLSGYKHGEGGKEPFNFKDVAYFENPEDSSNFKPSHSLDDLSQKYINKELSFKDLKDAADEYKIDVLKFATLLQFNADKKGLTTNIDENDEKVGVEQNNWNPIQAMAYAEGYEDEDIAILGQNPENVGFELEDGSIEKWDENSGTFEDWANNHLLNGHFPKSIV